MVVIAGGLAGMALKDLSRLAAKHVPDRQALAILESSALDLIRRRGGSPYEFGRKFHGLF